MYSSLWVELKEKSKSYPIFISENPIETLKDSIAKFTPTDKILVVISEKVNRLYRKKLGFSNKNKFVLKDGEVQKTMKNYEKILNKAQALNLGRSGSIIAIGGGVVGDIAGFVAATYLRGINFIQVPTTLLAAVDSSVGGKVAVDTTFGKNLVGAFYQPSAVFINLNFLKTLDKRQFKSGLGEILKYAFIEKSCPSPCDHGFFDFLKFNFKKIIDKDFLFLEKIIKMSLELKLSVVTKDEKEANLRKILNFGHTYGHALEKITNYKKFTHGEAVVYGMFFIINYAHKLKIIDANYKEACFELINLYGFKDKQFKYNKKKMIKLMQSDKKATQKSIKVIVPTAKSLVEEQELNIDLV